MRLSDVKQCLLPLVTMGEGYVTACVCCQQSNSNSYERMLMKFNNEQDD